MRSSKVFVLGLALLTLTYSVNAQVKERKVVDTKRDISAFSNSGFRVLYQNDKQTVLTLRSIPITLDRNIVKTVFNPAGASFAAIYDNKDYVKIYSFLQSETEIAEIKDKRKKLEEKPYPVTAAYGPDARSLAVSNTLGEIVMYDTKEYAPSFYLKGEGIATDLDISSNNYFVASAVGKDVVVWNLQTKQVRVKLPFTATVKEVAFSPDAAKLAVASEDNKIYLYDTKTWKDPQVYDNVGEGISSISFHPDGKYFSAVKGNNSIVVLNHITAEKDSEFEQQTDNSIKDANFFKNNSTGEVFVLSNRAKSLVFWDASELTPYYGKTLDSEVNAKMNEWIKMMDGESMEDYAIRVNDETRLKQQQLFSQEVATNMAGDRIAIDNPFVGGYDASSNMLSIGFEKMSGIKLEVSADEATQFGDAKNLKFENAVYVLNENDEFELAYVEVKNETTNKVYIFDNIGRLKLQAMENDMNFVPLEIMQQASQEEVKLQAIKEEVVAENKNEKLISDNTQINVKTEVLPDVNADGEKILNYKIGYQYEVINKAFSAKEDFPAGQFITEKSNAAMSLLNIIKKAFEGDFAKYLGPDKQVKIIITGSADASRILNVKPYDERYGRFVDEPYYKDGNLDNITVTKESGISTNDQLALMRAAGVHDYIVNNIETLKDTQNTYEYHVEVAKEKGSEFRRINVEFIIVDAFPQK